MYNAMRVDYNTTTRPRKQSLKSGELDLMDYRTVRLHLYGLQDTRGAGVRMMITNRVLIT